MSAYTFWLIIFSFVTYFVATDQSVARAFYILTQLSRIQYEKIKWWILYNPANPVVKYFMWRRAYKLAKELQEELQSRNK
jgi:hypothetical protein